MVIEHAQVHGNTYPMLIKLPSYIIEHGIGIDLQDMASYTEHPDVAACQTFQSTVLAAGEDARVAQRRLQQQDNA